MSELEYREISSRLSRLEQNTSNSFLLGLYTDLVRQHISLLKDLVYNRFSAEDFENEMRLEKDLKILERNLENLNLALLNKNYCNLRVEFDEIIGDQSTITSNVN